MGARTYYVRYTWANDTGETLGSTQQSRAVSANNLLTTNVGFSSIPSGAKSMKIYVSTTSGSGWTLQTTISGILSMNSTNAWLWTEPTTGLVAGAALPGTNTTNTLTKYGIYELVGGAGTTYSNIYHDNYFIGIDTPIFKDASYDGRRITRSNYVEPSLASADSYVLEETSGYQYDIIVPDEAYGVAWNGSLEVPTKNAIYDKIETLPSATTTSGVYTPTRSAEANLDSNVTPSEAQYMRVGSTVTVSGNVTINPTLTTTATSWELTIPVASNIGAVEDLAGTFTCGQIAAMSGAVSGSVANNTAVFNLIATDVNSNVVYYQYSYQVI